MRTSFVWKTKHNCTLYLVCGFNIEMFSKKINKKILGSTRGILLFMNTLSIFMNLDFIHFFTWITKCKCTFYLVCGFIIEILNNKLIKRTLGSTKGFSVDIFPICRVKMLDNEWVLIVQDTWNCKICKSTFGFVLMRYFYLILNIEREEGPWGPQRLTNYRLSQVGGRFSGW